MAFLDNEGLRHLWGHITSKLSKKVDKVDGKGLSTNDYTTEEKEKLASVLTEEQIIELIDMHGGGSSAAYIAKTVTLSTDGWYQRSERDGFIYELEFPGMTTDAIVEVSIAADQAMMEEACRCGVICWRQEENYLLFKTMYDVPTIDIDVEILVFSNANLSTIDLLIGTGVVE